jgi:putative ABC transport system permease protein
MASFRQDIRFGLRLLLRHPGHTLAAVLALGLGIGLATAMFSIIYGVLFRGLPVPEAGHILSIGTASPALDQPTGVDPHDFLGFRQRQRSFVGLAAYARGMLSLSGDGGQPERLNSAAISANGFDLLRVRPVLGRGFLPGEDSPRAESVAVLSDSVWKTRYRRDPGVLGRLVRINGQSSTIVGVMPEGFAFPGETEVWLPLRLDPLRLQRGQGEPLEVMGRLAAGVPVAAARAEIQGITKDLAFQHPETSEGRTTVVEPWMEAAIGGRLRRLLWTMLGACLLVLLIACANVASLMVARAVRRTHEIAIRAALGASRGRIVVQLLLESLLAALLGGGLGVLLARCAVQAFNSAIAAVNPPFWLRIAIDPAALLFSLGLTLLAAVLSGLLPALQAAKTDLGEVLKDEGRGSSSLRLGRLSRYVIIGEVAFSCLLLIGTGLMIRSVVAARTLDLSFDPAHLLTARIALFEPTYPREKDRARFFDELLQRLADHPGVIAAAATTNLPGEGSELWTYRVEGRADGERELPRARAAMISAGFLETFGVRPLAGRNFGPRDTAESLPVVIVNRSFAAKVWPDQDPLGKRICLDAETGTPHSPWRTVIGVAPDLQMSSVGAGKNETPEGFYLPLAQRCPGFISLAVRTRVGNPLALASRVRQQVSALDRDLPIDSVFPLDEVLARIRFVPALFASLFAVFGLAALTLAAVGIYGVIAFSVSQRTQEIGIRMALGAERRDVLRLFLRQGLWQLACGLGAGLLAAFFASRLLAAFLIDIEPRDPVTFTLVPLLLALVSLAACWLPARRATRTDPLVAMRSE